MYNDTQDPYNQDPQDPQQQPVVPRLTGPITDPNDPRLSDGSYASDPSVLSYLNQQGAQTQVQQGNANTPNTPDWQTSINAATPAAKPVDAPGGRPTGNLNDPAFRAKFIAWAGQQPGVNPSVKNDPGYWDSRFASGAFGNDADYAFARMMQAEGAPEGSGAPAAGSTPPPGQTAAPAPIAAPNLSLSGSGISDQQQKANDLYDYLMGKAKQSQVIDPNDPLIRSQSDNYSANLTRTGRQYLSELAERKGAGGNIGAESRMVAEKNAQAGASHEGELIQHESDQRRQEIEQALALGSQFMTAQQQMSLQKELATIDANMKLYQSQVQQQQFGASQAQQASQFGQNLSQNQSQFGSTMGARADEFAKNLSQRAYEYDTDNTFRNSPLAK